MPLTNFRSICQNCNINLNHVRCNKIQQMFHLVALSREQKNHCSSWWILLHCAGCTLSCFCIVLHFQLKKLTNSGVMTFHYENVLHIVTIINQLNGENKHNLEMHV